MEQIIQEIFFWSEIMRDHAEFQIMNISSREVQSIRTSQNFKNLFNQIHDEAERLINNPNNEQTEELVRRVMPIIIDFINYKQSLLRRLLQCDIEFNLPPTFINHMINEAMEFYRAISMLQSDAPINRTTENLFLHTKWLPDAIGHAANIMSTLDATETILIKEGETYKNTFTNLFIKATELEKMLPRTGLDNGALELLNEEVIATMTDFIEYLENIEVLRENCKAMGVIPPLVPDHMIREERYYLSKVASFMQ